MCWEAELSSSNDSLKTKIVKQLLFNCLWRDLIGMLVLGESRHFNPPPIVVFYSHPDVSWGILSLGSKSRGCGEARALLIFHGILEGAKWLLACLLGFAWFSSHFSLGFGQILLVYGFSQHTSPLTPSLNLNLAVELGLPDCHTEMPMPWPFL